MRPPFRLQIVTPLAVVLDRADVVSVLAEDATGRFGLWPGHADFLTVLPVSVASWRLADGSLHHGALRGGVLSVTAGALVEIATAEAVTGEDLAQLSGEVLRRFRAEADSEKAEHVEQTRLHLAAIRQMVAGLGRRAAEALG